jgi:dTDP-L-rhamnose 4-epimerase
MRILVTGGAGFVGSHVVDRLVEGGHDIVVLDNLDPQVHGEAADRPHNIAGHVDAGRVTFMRGDVRNRDDVRRALDGVDSIAHLAAAVGVGQSMYEPYYYADVNVAGQGMLLEEMAREPQRYRRFVVASSMSIYGEGTYVCAEHGAMAAEPRPEDRLERGQWEVPCPQCGADMAAGRTAEDKPLQFTSIYAITKKTQEEMALCFGRAYHVPTVALRFFNVFGSRQALSNPYTGVAAIFMGRLKNNRPPLVFEDGLQSRDFVHVHDVADAVVRSLELDHATSGAYNVCTGRPVSIAEVGAALGRLMGVDLEPEAVGRYRAGDIRHCVGDPTLAREVLGFEAQRSFDEGLAELMSWAAEQEADDKVEASFEELKRQGLVR